MRDKMQNKNMLQLKKQAFIVSLVMIVFSAAKAQEPNSGNFSLQQSIDYAIKNSPSYLNAELDQQSAEYRRKEIAGLGLPQINGSIDFKDYIEIPTSLFPVSAFNPAAPPDAYTAVKFGLKYNATAGLKIGRAHV